MITGAISVLWAGLYGSYTSLASQIGWPLLIGLSILTCLVVVLICLKIIESIIDAFYSKTPPNKFTKALGYLLDFLKNEDSEWVKERGPNLASFNLASLLVAPRAYTAYHTLEQYSCSLAEDDKLKYEIEDILSYFSTSSSYYLDTIPSRYSIKKTKPINDKELKRLGRLTVSIRKKLQRIKEEAES